MARPKKHNADYFSHDNNMRNDMKIKLLRRKYKSDGYALYVMLLELLTSNEYFEIEWNEESIELLSPEFDMDTDVITEIVNYCIEKNLLQLTHGILHCDKLTERLEGDVLSRRTGYDINKSKRMVLMLQYNNNNGINVDNNLIDDNNNPQRKGKEIKGNKSKVNKTKVEELIAELYIADRPSDIETLIQFLDGIGWDYIYSVLEATEDMKYKLKQLVANKLIILETN